MATLTPANQLSLIELLNRTGDANAIAIAERLTVVNQLFLDAIWMEANQALSHVFTARTALPTGTFRRFNDGVAKSASLTRQVSEPIATLEAYSEVDVGLADLAPNPSAFRSSEDISFVEGLGQTAASKFIYADAALATAEFDGLATRLNTLGTVDGTAYDSGGTGSDLTSCWVVQWALDGVFMVFPRGSKVGLTMEDRGKQYVAGITAGTKFDAWVTHFAMKLGVVVKDVRSVQRLANIEASGAGAFDDDHLVRLLNRLPRSGAGAVIYANQALKTQMDVKAKDQSNMNWLPGQFGGLPVTMFRGVPVRQLDAILNTEAALV
jgi:hypothetical protein